MKKIPLFINPGYGLIAVLCCGVISDLYFNLLLCGDAVSDCIYIMVALLIIVDVTFTAEFIYKSMKSGSSRGFRHYFFTENGWLDLINGPVIMAMAGIPLIFFIMSSATGESGLMILYRTGSAFRILRILKLAAIIDTGRSVMASRHTAIIANYSIISVFVSALIIAISGHYGIREISVFYLIAITIAVISRVIYRKHFESTISDVIEVIDLGMRRRNFNRHAMIINKYIDDEIFRIAAYYNNYFLPAKIKQILALKTSKGDARERDLRKKV